MLRRAQRHLERKRELEIVSFAQAEKMSGVAKSPYYLIKFKRDRLLTRWDIWIDGKEDRLDLHFCYLAATSSRNKIKIGYSDNPEKGIKYLKQGRRGNVKVKLVAFFKGGYELESAIKRKFRKYKCNKPHCSMGNDWIEGNKETLAFVSELEFYLKFRNQ